MNKIFTFLIAVLCYGTVMSQTYTYKLGEHPTFAEIPVNLGYGDYNFDYPEASIFIEEVSRQGQTVTNVPVVKDGIISIVLTDKTKCIKSVAMSYVRWSSDNKTVNLLSSFNGTDFVDTGVSIRTSATLRDFPTTNLPPNSVGARFDLSSSSKKIGLESITLTIGEKTNDPVLAPTVTSVDCGELIVNEETESSKSFNIFGLNLTGDVSLDITGTDAAMFSLDKTSLTPVEGSLMATIMVTYKPTEASDGHTASLNIASEGVKTVSLPLSGSYVERKTGGSGTKDDPYSVLDVQTLGAIGDNVWAQGYIVGIATGTGTGTNLTSANLKGPFSVNSNVVLAPTAGETSPANMIPVKLDASTDARTYLNLVDHPENQGKLVKVYGSLATYFSATGLKYVTNYEFVDGSSVGDITNTHVSVVSVNGNIEIEGAIEAPVSVYNASGIEVYSGRENSIAVPAKGLYIVRIDGKAYKVIVK